MVKNGSEFGGTSKKEVLRKKRFVARDGSGVERFLTIQALSSVEVFGLYPGKDEARCIAEFPNSNGAATVLWSLVCYEVLKRSADFWLTENCSEFWNIPARSDLPEGVRALVALTQQDHLFVSARNFDRLANHIQEFFGQFCSDDFELSHWDEIRALLLSKPDFAAIGFRWSYCWQNFWSPVLDYDDDDEYSKSGPNWNEAVEVFDFIKQLDSMSS